MEKKTTLPHSHRGVMLWLVTVCLLILATVVVGGVTRLTESGLSIVDWQPIVGALPPLNQEEWHRAFDAYKQFPQFQKVNQNMSLAEFKFIFFWEYLHRNLGRMIGLVFFGPFVYFWIRRRLSKPLFRRLLVAFVLGGMQGLLGWYMVKSGLVDMPRVSHYRLAAHLSLALFIMVYLFWIMLGLWPKMRWPESSPTNVRRFAKMITAFIALQIVYGAFTAGLRAGIGYNTFPTMNGAWIPDGLDFIKPVWLNLFENPVTVQFIHRSIAWVLLVGISLFWFTARKLPLSTWQRRGVNLLGGAMLLQFTLGVLTLVLVVPISIASLHQLGACFLLLSAIYVNYAFLPKSAALKLKQLNEM